jgi:O-antigen ligase
MGLLVALFTLAALVWMIPIIRGARLLRVSLVVLVTGTIFGPKFFAIDGPIQFSLDRVLWFGMLVMAVIHLRIGNVQLPALTRIDWLLLAFTGFLLLGAMRGGSPPTGSSPLARWLFYIVMPLGVYAVGRTVRISAADVRVLTYTLLGLGVYLAATAVLEVAGLHAAVFPKYILDPQVFEFYGRGRGPLLNPAGNGMVITIALTLAILGIIKSDRRAKLIYAAITVVLLCGTYATLTRSVWLGAIGVIGIIAMVYCPRWVRVLGLAATLLLGGAMMMGLKDQLLSMKRDKQLSAAEAAKSVELRPLLAIVAWEMFQDRPIIGHGFGHYFQHNRPYHDTRKYGLPLEEVREYGQHNTFLAILVDAGLIGVLLYLSILVMLLAVGWRLAKERIDPAAQRIGVLLLGTLVIYFCNAMFHDVLVIPMVQMFLLFVAGCSVTLYQTGIATEGQRVTSAMPVLRRAQLSH